MSGELPFRLKVSGTDEVQGFRAVSTSFRFHGWLRLDGAQLRIEWDGFARVQDVGAASIRDKRLSLPAETLIVPVARLRRAELLGGWWRPRLAISARDVRALALVPSEELGTVQFWYARRDRLCAVALSDGLGRAIAAAAEAGEVASDIVHLSASTPVTPPNSHERRTVGLDHGNGGHSCGLCRLNSLIPSNHAIIAIHDD